MKKLFLCFVCLITLSLYSQNQKKGALNFQGKNHPYSENKLMAFKNFSDSIIQIAIKKKSVKYRLKTTILKDAQLKRFDDYVSTNDLINVTSYDFNLPLPDSRYSFELIFYQFKSDLLAINSLNKQATIAYAAEFGLIKAPVSVFRIRNYIIWLITPNALSGKTFKALNKKLKSQFSEDEIDALEKHIQYENSTKFEDETLLGKWKLKLISPLYKNDTTHKKTYDKITIQIEKESIKLDSLEFKIERLDKISLPDAATFISNFERIEPKEINSKLKKLQGPLVLYIIDFKDTAITLQNNKLNYELFNSRSLLKKFIKFSNNEFGFITNEAYYELIKVEN